MLDQTGRDSGLFAISRIDVGGHPIRAKLPRAALRMRAKHVKSETRVPIHTHSIQYERMAEKRRQDAAMVLAARRQGIPDVTLGARCDHATSGHRCRHQGRAAGGRRDVPLGTTNSGLEVPQIATSEATSPIATSTSPTGRRFYIASLYY